MFSAGARHKATSAEEGSSVMERSQETASTPPSSPKALLRARSPVLAPRAHVFSTSGSQNYLPITFDRTDQVAPPGAKTRLTASFWEDEGSLCFQVEARGVCVARREDNHMINGTKLLSVAGLGRGRRDGILKSEKTRHVVKTGPMHLKGVWIPFERALALANKEKITELLYPLFVHDIKQLLYDPKNQKRTYLANPQRKSQETKEWAEPTESHARQIDVPEESDKTSQKILLDTLRNDELHERGPIGSLSRSLIETLGLILIEVRTHSDSALHYGSLESSCAALFFWDIDLGLSRGDLDDMLQDSPQLRDTCLTVLVSISQFVSTSLIHLISSEQRRKEVLQSTRILTCLDQTANMIEQQCHSTHEPEQDVEALCQILRTKIDTLIMLAPSLESPAEESFDDEEPRTIQYIEKHLPEQAYINSISEKFPLAESAIIAQLGKLNWDRYNHMLHLQRETVQQELQMAAMEKARTIFNDSGLGVSLPAQSKAASSSGSVYAPSIMSTRAEASHKRVPPLPAQARSGEPFTCEICNKQVKFQRTKAWKKHVFSDILAYACFFAECCNTRMFFEDSDALMTHLQDQHGMDVRISDVECPLCMEFTSGDRDILTLHIARHMEEIALAILPSGVDSEEESADESGSVIRSDDSSESSERVIQSVEENSTDEGTGVVPTHAGNWECADIRCGNYNLASYTACLRCGASRAGAAVVADSAFPLSKDTPSYYGMAPPVGAGPGSGVNPTDLESQSHYWMEPTPRYKYPLTETSDVQSHAPMEDMDTENLVKPYARFHTTIRRTSQPTSTRISPPRFPYTFERTPSPPDLSYMRQDPYSQRPTGAQLSGISFEPLASHQTQRKTPPERIGRPNSLEGEDMDPMKGGNSDLHFTGDSPLLSLPQKPLGPLHKADEEDRAAEKARLYVELVNIKLGKAAKIAEEAKKRGNEDKPAKLPPPPAPASINYRFAHYDPFPPVHDGARGQFDTQDYGDEATFLPNSISQSHITPIPQIRLPPLLLSPHDSSKERFEEPSRELKSGPQDNTEPSSEQGTKIEDTFSSNDLQLPIYGNMNIETPEVSVSSDSEPEDNSKSPSEQQTRPGGAPDYPGAIELYFDALNSLDERGGRVESEHQDNIEISSEQQSRPRRAYRSYHAPGTKFRSYEGPGKRHEM
ncbi:hypothetical protein PSV08DRAFT_389873 [Bipolaris maydis]|nr:hypothetical protein J3E73DRAFT_411563 [Bipolaris maydis]KAJ6271601.1 hypothetical protein PSV08DRAFT_389873 [Bipolaris maydis]